MKTTREKVQEVYLDKKNWHLTPPTIRWIAKMLGVSIGTVQRYVEEVK